MKTISLATLLTLTLAGCGDGGTNGGDGGMPDSSCSACAPDSAAAPDLAQAAGPATPGDFIHQLFGIPLGRLLNCCTPGDMTSADYQFTYAILKAFGDLIAQVVQTGATDGRLTYDAAAAGNCLSQLMTIFAGVPCGASTNVGQMMLTCSRVTTGHQMVGQGCASDADCADGLTCVGYIVGDPTKGLPGSDGACRMPPAAGAACGAGRTDAGVSLSLDFGSSSSLFGTHPQCVTGYYCQDSKCVVQAQAGGQCVEDKQCVTGLTCHLQVCGMAGPAAAGAACKGTSDCMSGLYCNTMTGKCTTKETAGQPCVGFGGQCLGRCSVPDGGSAGTCVPFCGSM
jgi:hypothetical protein